MLPSRHHTARSYMALFALVFAAHIPKIVEGNGIEDFLCRDPLACFLDSIVFPIPDICAVVEGSELCMKNIQCSGIQLDHLPSSYTPPTTFGLGVQGLGTKCSADYSYGKFISGDVTATVKNTDIAVEVLVDTAQQKSTGDKTESKEDTVEEELPTAIAFSSCAVESFSIDFKFSGGLLDHLSGILARAIEKEMNDLICVEFAQFVAVNGTEAILTQLDPWLMNVISSEPSELPTYEDPHWIKWSDSIIGKIHDIALPTAHSLSNSLSSIFDTLFEDLLGIPTSTPSAFTSASSYTSHSHGKGAAKKQHAISVTGNKYADSSTSPPSADYDICWQQTLWDAMAKTGMAKTTAGKPVNAAALEHIELDLSSQRIELPLADLLSLSAYFPARSGRSGGAGAGSGSVETSYASSVHPSVDSGERAVGSSWLMPLLRALLPMSSSFQQQMATGLKTALAPYSSHSSASSTSATAASSPNAPPQAAAGGAIDVAGLLKNASVRVIGLSINGTETLQGLQILQPTAPAESNVTLRTAANMEYLSVDLKLLIHVPYYTSSKLSKPGPFSSWSSSPSYGAHTAAAGAAMASADSQSLQAELMHSDQKRAVRALHADSSLSSRSAAASAGTLKDDTEEEQVQGLVRHDYTQAITLSIRLEDLSLLVDLVALADGYLLDSLYLDQLMSSGSGCWMDVLQSLSIANMMVDIGSIVDVSVSQGKGTAGALEGDVAILINNLSHFFTQGFPVLLRDTLEGVMQGPVRAGLNAELATKIASMKKESICATHYPFNDRSSFVVWANNSLIQAVDFVVDELVGYEGVDKLMDCLTDGTGSLNIAVDSVGIQLKISGLDSFYALQLLMPRVTEEEGGGVPAISAVPGALGGPASTLPAKFFELENAISFGYERPASSPTLAPTPISSAMPTRRFSGEEERKVVEVERSGVSLPSKPTLPPFPSPLSPYDVPERPFQITVTSNAFLTAEKALITSQTLPSRTADARARFLRAATSAAAVAAGSDLNSEPAASMSMSGGMDIELPPFQVTLSMKSMEIFFDSLFELDQNSIYDLQYHQLTTTGCVPSTVDTFALQSMNLSISDFEILVSVDPSQGLALDASITDYVNLIFGYLTQPQALSRLNEHVQGKVDHSAAVCANNGVDPDDGGKDTGGGSSSSDAWKWQLVLLVAGCSASLVGLIWAYHHWGQVKKHRRIHRRYQKRIEMHQKQLIAQVGDRARLPSMSSDGGTTLLELGAPSTATWAEWGAWKWDKWDCENALVFHSSIPLWVRVLFPTCVLGNVGLFISSNYAPDAVSVMVTIFIGSQEIDLGSVFDFGLANTVSDMWDAEVYTLAALIALFSGLWPYIKLFSMLAAWVVPPHFLGVQRRELMLKVLDVLGKWSLLDFFVMVLMIVAFYFDLVLSSSPVLIVSVTVLPKWGFYGFLLATMVSLGLGHIVLACHRLIVDPRTLPLAETVAATESLCSLTYRVHADPPAPLNAQSLLAQQQQQRRGTTATDDRCKARITAGTGPVVNQEDVHLSRDEPLQNATTATSITSTSSGNRKGRKTTKYLDIRVTWIGIIALIMALLFTAFLLIAGTFVETVRFEFKGLTGLLLGADAISNYSFVDIGNFLPIASGTPDDFGVRWLQASLFMFGLGMPLALLFALGLIWVVPLSMARQKELFALIEVLNAWSALDVYCIAIAASLLEISQFALFMVGDACDGINVVLAEYADALLDGDDKCFDVLSTMKSSSWMIFVSASFLLLISIPSLMVTSFALRHRWERTRRALIAKGGQESASALLTMEEGENGEEEEEGEAGDNDVDPSSRSSAPVFAYPAVGGGGGSRSSRGGARTEETKAGNVYGDSGAADDDMDRSSGISNTIPFSSEAAERGESVSVRGEDGSVRTPLGHKGRMNSIRSKSFILQTSDPSDSASAALRADRDDDAAAAVGELGLLETTESPLAITEIYPDGKVGRLSEGGMNQALAKRIELETARSSDSLSCKSRESGGAVVSKPAGAEGKPVAAGSLLVADGGHRGDGHGEGEETQEPEQRSESCVVRAWESMTCHNFNMATFSVLATLRCITVEEVTLEGEW